jgi:hypothetical protein
MKTLASLLLFLTISASAQVREVPVSTAQLGPADMAQEYPQVGSNSSDFLAAWTDNRGSWMYAARIRGDGTVLDPTGIPLPSTLGAITLRVIAVVWCGNAWVIVISGQDAYTQRSFTAVSRIDADGKVIEPPRTVVWEQAWAAASNGSRIIVVTGSANITVLDDRANFLDAWPTGVPGAYEWTAVSNGSTFMAVASNYDGRKNWVSAITMDSTGHVKTNTVVALTAQKTIAVPAGDGYSVLYTDVPSGDLMRFSITNGVAGGVSDLAPHLDALAGAPTDTGYVVAAETVGDRELNLVHGTDAATIDGQRYITSNGGAIAAWPVLASNGRDVLFVWMKNLETTTDLRGVIVDSNGEAKSEAFDVTQSAAQQQYPAIATGGPNDLVAWQERGGIYAARVTQEGLPLDGRGIEISQSLGAPQVIYDGTSYVVAWKPVDDSSIHFHWIDPATGESVGSTVTLNGCVTAFFLGRDSIGLVAFITDCNGRLYGQRIGTAGPIGPQVNISPAGVGAGVLSAACNGKEWLVTWEKPTLLPWFGFLPRYASTTYAQRLLLSLSTLDVQPIEIAASSVEEIGGMVATDGQDFAVVWSYFFNAPPNGQLGIYARSVSASGVAGEPQLFVAGTDLQSRSLVWDGNRYTVAYASPRESNYPGWDLLLTHIGASDRVAISSASPNQSDVSLAVAPGRPVRAAYDRIALEPAYGGAWRVFIRDLVQTRRR